MKRPYSYSQIYIINTSTCEYSEVFSLDWRDKEMYDYMISHFNISEDEIHTISRTLIKYFKLSK